MEKIIKAAVDRGASDLHIKAGDVFRARINGELVALTKQALNHVEELQGKRAAMDAAFAWHHFAHAHNELVSGDRLGGYDARKMASSQRKAGDEEQGEAAPAAVNGAAA